MKVKDNYNPDVLSCLANLSSDEVFTSPKLANEILDLLPKEIWSDKNATFFDPVCKSGVFLREIAKRLIEGLEKRIPDVQKRLDHIYKNQLFGIGITELTSLLSRRSLYCSKTANGKYSVTNVFNSEQGNIFFDTIDHDWKNGRCLFCGASQSEYEREEGLETHAYQFIHNNLPDKLKNMKFDVIIGNPPYQISDSGFGRSAKPLYHLFVRQAKKMNPRFLTMIIPARWYAGGKGLDDFRIEMLNDVRTRKLIDFENSSEVFPGVDIAGGICYFLWDRDNIGLCEVINISGDKRTSIVRTLNEFDTFIRHSRAIPIIKKVIKKTSSGKTLSQLVSSRKPFGLPTNYQPKKKGIPCWFTQKIGLKYADEADVTDANNLLEKWKLLIPPAPIAGQTNFSQPVGFYYEGNTVIAKPGECCTESWLVAGVFPTKAEAISFRSYIFTKIVRFLLLQTVVSQHVTKEKFVFVPDLGRYEGEYTDQALRKEWGITDEEWEFIDSRIK
ncbi:MAG: Eco57I restriction-modification methylase domain-containing protein [Candidatus Paceibacterota bacterium]|jgi:site-specific DNA-methyltransferase (adenine-specific)